MSVLFVHIFDLELVPDQLQVSTATEAVTKASGNLAWLGSPAHASPWPL